MVADSIHSSELDITIGSDVDWCVCKERTIPRVFVVTKAVIAYIIIGSNPGCDAGT